MTAVIRYLHEMKWSKAVLWCYLIWYLVVTYFYFDPSPKIWMNSIGISAVVGTALMLSVSSGGNGRRDYWQMFRLYLMPFCVSSFSALIKGQGFILFVSPRLEESLAAVSSCLLFVATIWAVKLMKGSRGAPSPPAIQPLDP
ncbi:hypothetical protein [Candidatus Nitrospira bockiana]